MELLFDNCTRFGKIANCKIGGTAVYNARTLNTMFQPNAQYNDKVLCVPNTQNKMASSNTITNLDSLYEAQTNTEASKLKEEIVKNSAVDYKNNIINNTINIYPNPAKDIINIKYNELTNGTLYHYNALGETVIQINLIAGNRIVVIPIGNITTGIYAYKVDFNGKINNGKINIIK